MPALMTGRVFEKEQAPAVARENGKAVKTSGTPPLKSAILRREKKRLDRVQTDLIDFPYSRQALRR